jgi:hypothetical protein
MDRETRFRGAVNSIPITAGLTFMSGWFMGCAARLAYCNLSILNRQLLFAVTLRKYRLHAIKNLQTELKFILIGLIADDGSLKLWRKKASITDS